MLSSPKLGPVAARERERAFMLFCASELSWLVVGWGREKRGGQGGGQPSWKRPCLIVPD